MHNRVPLADEIEIWTIAVGAMAQSVLRSHAAAMQARTWPEVCANAWADLMLAGVWR